MAVRKTGLTTIRTLALHMCRLITKWTVVIQVVYPASPELLIALAAANTACGALAAIATDTLEVGT